MPVPEAFVYLIPVTDVIYRDISSDVAVVEPQAGIKLGALVLYYGNEEGRNVLNKYLI